jgi:hypothetical protein
LDILHKHILKEQTWHEVQNKLYNHFFNIFLRSHRSVIFYGILKVGDENPSVLANFSKTKEISTFDGRTTSISIGAKYRSEK